MSNQQAHKASAWLNYQIEREGIARLTIFILLLTTVAMLAYTWGYAEVRSELLWSSSWFIHPSICALAAVEDKHECREHAQCPPAALLLP